MKQQTMARLGAFLGGSSIIASLMLTSLSAQAVPSYARQTGEACADCHVGSFGPQLTPHGMKFKIGGYTDAKDDSFNIPLSGMVVESFTQTSEDQTEIPGKGFDTNDNFSLQEVSAFIAGRFSENIGTFIQITHSEPDRITAMDSMDARFVKAIELGGKDTTIGVSLSNNPMVQDPFNTTSVWRFPYTESGLAPGHNADVLINGGLEIASMGATVYALHDDHWYAEVGGYQSLADSTLSKINVETGDKIDGTAPYWRFAYTNDMHKQAFEVGVFGLSADMFPGGQSGASDKYHDMGVDASYIWLGTRQHICTLNASYVHESRTLDAGFNAGEVSKLDGILNRLDVSTSYHYDNTYGVTFALFDINGNYDDLLYNNGEADFGSVNGSPDTRGYNIQADFTPWGKEGSWGAPWANVRLGLQYTGYNDFNGNSDNYDGLGRDASDNNTILAFAWLAF